MLIRSRSQVRGKFYYVFEDLKNTPNKQQKL